MSSNLKSWGLYKADSAQAIPLKHIDISIQIFHNVARVIYSQEYFNDAANLIETEIFFPISPDACFDSFEATFNNTTIKGVVKEKEKAKEEYKQAIEQGKTAAYSEINKETGDIMKVMIGNIPPNTNIKVTYSYIQKLETSLNKFWCFRLFSTLTPRYNNMSNLQDFLNHDVQLLSSYPTVSKNSTDAYPWSIQAEIHSPSPITFLKSPSHDIKTTYGNENHTCNITLNSNAKHFPNKDFILLFSNGRENKVDYLMTPFEDGYCAMVSLLADFDNSSTEDAFNNFAKAKEVENLHSMSSVRGEYLFLIDRSGSMEGERITMAKDSLILFLKSLPKDSYFNVISFGSDYTFLHPESLLYSQQSIDSSIQQIQGFNADMGGTEIHAALHNIFSHPPKKGYPRFVFLLTDGAVSNTQRVLNLILANNDKTRTFTIGVGNGCSSELITQGATYGRGKAQFVTDNNQIFERVIDLLNSSLSPCYSDLALHADNFDAVVKGVSPNPASIPFLINGQTVTFFLFLRSAAFQDSKKMDLQLSMYDSRKQKSQTVNINLDATEAFENELIPKLAIHDMIKRLEQQKDQVSANKNKSEEIIWMNEDDLQKTMTEYSLKYGILCKETAFFCEISDSQTNTKNIVPSRIVIPTTISQDYEMGYSTLKSSPYSYLKRKSGSPPKSSEADGQAVQLSSRLHLLEAQRTAQETLELGNNTLLALQRQREQLEKAMQACNSLNDDKRENSGILKGLSRGFSNTMDSLVSKFSRSNKSTTQADKPEPVLVKNIASESLAYEFPSLSTETPSSSRTSQLKAKPRSSYLNIIMKQKFEGCWDPSDHSLRQTILKDGTLTQLPSEINVINPTQREVVWITILVMRWLEVACKDDRKAWLLVYQKASEWLETQGVKYDEVKDRATSSLKSN